MVDTTIESIADTAFHARQIGRFSVSPAPGIAYCLFIGSSPAAPGFEYRKLSGGSWGNRVSVDAEVSAFDTYYDKWTKNVTTTKWLILHNETDIHDALFNALDVSDDSLDGPQTVLAGTSFSSTASFDLSVYSVVRAEGGNIYAWVDGDGGTEIGFLRSVDDGANWTARTTTGLFETSSDRILLLPGNETDTDDIYALYYDESAGELTLKVYDNSGNSWSESSAVLSGLSTSIDSRIFPFAAAQRHSDGHIIGVVMTEEDAATTDLKVVDITNASTFSTLTDVITNVDDWGYPSILINQQNDDLYVVYLGSDAGDEALGSSVLSYYQVSTNGGSTWGGEQAMGVTSDDLRSVSAGVSINDDGGNFIPIWFNDDFNDTLCNLDNDIEIAAAGVAASYVIPHPQSATRNRLIRR